MTELTAETFRKLYAELLARPPVVVAIWFVDRPAEYCAVRSRYGYPEHTDPFALPLYEWRRSAESPEDRRPGAFVDIPGIWGVMSDGKALPWDLVALPDITP